MTASREELLTRLDAAMASWDQHVSDAYRGLCDRVNCAQEQVLLLHQESQARDADRAALQEARGRLAALQDEIARRDGEMTAAGQQRLRLAEENAALTDRIRRLESDHAHAAQVADTVIGELSARVSQLERDLEAARSESAQHSSIHDSFQEVRNALAAERVRADVLQDELRDARDAEARAGSEQLACALRDRDEAHQQIVALRAEIDLLRRMNASLSVPAPHEAAVDAEPVSVPVPEPSGRKRRMGDVLVELGVVSREQLEDALHEQAFIPQRRLGAILVEKGFASEEAIARILARQLGLAFVCLVSEVVDVAATRIIGPALARRRHCVPIAVSPDRIVLAMANPLDLIAIDDVELAGNRAVEPVVATASDIQAAIDRYYGS